VGSPVKANSFVHRSVVYQLIRQLKLIADRGFQIEFLSSP
jgi:hypothetical protein